MIAELQPTAGNDLMSAPDDDKIVQTISMPVTIVSPGEGAVTYEQETGVTDVQTAYAQTSEATTALLYLTNYQSYWLMIVRRRLCVSVRMFYLITVRVTTSFSAIVFVHFPDLGSAHQVFILNVLRCCASSLCTPFPFIYLKPNFRQYPAIHTNYSWSNCTIWN